MNISQDALPPTCRTNVRDSLAFKYRGLIGALILVPAMVGVIFSSPLIQENTLLESTLNVVGWTFFLLYLAIRVWATLFVGGNKDRWLQTDGPYSVCRNPLYLGSLCYALSLGMVLKSATFTVALLALYFFYQLAVVRDEERVLRLRFGDVYEEYCRRTPRFWPHWQSFRSPTHVQVDLRRLGQEALRMSRAAVVPMLLGSLMHLRHVQAWPVWFHLP